MLISLNSTFKMQNTNIKLIYKRLLKFVIITKTNLQQTFKIINNFETYKFQFAVVIIKIKLLTFVTTT